MATSHNLHGKRHSSVDSTHVAAFLSAHEEDLPLKGAQPAMASPHKQSSIAVAPVMIVSHEEDSAHKPVSPRHCLCSPTTHEGSFRCRLHRSSQLKWPKVVGSPKPPRPEDVSATTNEWAKSLLPPHVPKWSANIPPRPPVFSASASKSIEAQ